jgi:hypothetical protein
VIKGAIIVQIRDALCADSRFDAILVQESSGR